MTYSLPVELADKLRQFNQLHLLEEWTCVSAEQQSVLQSQLRTLEFELIFEAVQDHTRSTHTSSSSKHSYEQVRAPQSLIRRPGNSAEKEDWKKATHYGESLLKEGKIAALVVAGGQGTRLGFDHPKGMFPAGPVSGKSLFQGFCEQLVARGNRAGHPIPYFVMTSDATHSETAAFFQDHDFFGLNSSDVYFFRQGNMPVLDSQSLTLMLEAPGQLAFSPDGHGGLLRALQLSGMLADMIDQGIEHLYYHQVDNPFAILCDPAFLGWHALKNSDISTKVVPKLSAEEKMGVAVDIDGVTQIIEYSDLPGDVARRKTVSGELDLWAGNTAMHVFSVKFLQQLTAEKWSLPFHIAHKAVPYFCRQQGLVSPRMPNAFKLERFIFDVLPKAACALIVEADRQREFNPLKNAQGANSPDEVRKALIDMHRNWLRSAGYRVSLESPVEISPMCALEAEDLIVEPGHQILPSKLPGGLLWQ